jgi:DNA-binding transcriptional ArsR family regulator
MSGFESQAKLFKALMHPARLEILHILRQDEECVCHMECLLGHRQAYISQQLSVLREAGLVQDRRDGLNIFYSANPDIYPLIDHATQFTSSWPEEQRPKPRPKSGAGKCPCPKCNPDKSPIESTAIKITSAG